MKQTLSTLEAANILFNDEFAGWTYAAAYALVEYLEELEEETGEEMELDRIALRCEFSEYKSAVEAASYFDEDFSEFTDSEAVALAYFDERTNVITFEGGVLIQQF